MRNSVLALMMVALSSASGSVVGYHIEPVKAAWSGWTPQFGNVSQSVVACWDSLERVELFAGTRGNSGYYHVAVYDSGTLVMWSDGEQDWDSRWVRFENWDRRAAFTKGKQYKFQFSRGPYGGIQYYYSEDPYKYGQLIVGQQEYPDRDLAMRAYGRMNVPDRSFWGGFAALPFWNGVNEPNRRDTWRVYMNETGWGSATFVCDWSINQPSTPDSWDFYDTDAHIREICNTGARPIGILLFSPPWITSREDSTSGGGYGPVPYAAPRNLWPGESETNYYARWVDTLLGHLDQANPSLGSPADSVHTWVIWNEPNDTLNYGTPSTTGWWRRPNLTYTDGFDGLRGLCLLYMRMCYVVNQRLRSDTKHQYDRLLIGAMHRDVLRSDSNLVSGVDWLDMCYQVAEDSGWGIFWDGVAEHAYQEESFVLSPTKLEFSAETLRAVMHEHEDYSSELWNTECGWNCRPRGMTREEDANNVCAAFAASLALQALPSAGGGYDGLCWWLPYYPGTGSWNWMWLWDDTLDEVSLDPQYGYYSFKQTRSTLAGKRFNGRVMTGDSAGDTKVRMYEFEDPASLKKTWVCWSTLGAQDGGLVAGLPARSDTAETTALDYGDNPQPSDKPAAATGWLWPVLTSRPVFITEPDERAISRPDLVLDSIMVPVGAQVRSVMDVHAFVKNLGNDTTPDTVALDFLCDTTVFAHGTSGWPIAPGDSYDISFEINPIPEWMGGWHLFWARVNPGQTYVEKVSMDDNCGYVRRCIRCPPNGRVDVVGSPLCKADMPILPLRLESHSWESDSTGETPADSARVLFAWYGQGDSVVHATDTTAWFPFCTDTVLEYPRGCGVYSVQAQFRDSGANDSPFYGDSTDSIVVFDSVPPAGSIIIEDGGEFASIRSAPCGWQLLIRPQASAR